jgi:hypothetical protein
VSAAARGRIRGRTPRCCPRERGRGSPQKVTQSPLRAVPTGQRTRALSQAALCLLKVAGPSARRARSVAAAPLTLPAQIPLALPVGGPTDCAGPPLIWRPQRAMRRWRKPFPTKSVVALPPRRRALQRAAREALMADEAAATRACCRAEGTGAGAPCPARRRPTRTPTHRPRRMAAAAALRPRREAERRYPASPALDTERRVHINATGLRSAPSAAPAQKASPSTGPLSPPSYGTTPASSRGSLRARGDAQRPCPRGAHLGRRRARAPRHARGVPRALTGWGPSPASPTHPCARPPAVHACSNFLGLPVPICPLLFPIYCFPPPLVPTPSPPGGLEQSGRTPQHPHTHNRSGAPHQRGARAPTSRRADRSASKHGNLLAGAEVTPKWVHCY